MPTILLTDDQTDYRKTVMDILRLQGFNVIEASTGVEALEKAREHKPDCIVCDVDLPVLDGFEVLAAVKRDAALVAVPFLLVSARADSSAAVRARVLGADEFLIKPIDVRLLLNRIHTYLDPPQGPGSAAEAC